jgi:uncharacterized protein YaiI (UPF0178 family)
MKYIGLDADACPIVASLIAIAHNRGSPVLPHVIRRPAMLFKGVS